jgi:hypothetical protein
MPTPKMNAPATTARPGAAIDPRTGWPKNDPEARTGKNTRQVAASISICARTPAPRRSLISTRQAEVKPNAA